MAVPSIVSFLTFNAGMYPGYVPGYSIRQPYAVRDISQSTADVICLQEVWNINGQDIPAITAATKDSFPYTYFPPPKPYPTTGPACAGPEIVASNVSNCVLANCAPYFNVCLESYLQCVSTTCAVAVGTLAFLNLRCANCVTNAGAQQPPAQAIATCLAGDVAFSANNAFGLGLLSKYPIAGATFTNYTYESTVRRGYISAVTAGVNVLCTHVTPSTISGTLYTGKLPNGTVEMDSQIAELRAAALNLTGPVVVMGDFNAGPTFEPIQYNKILAGTDLTNAIVGHQVDTCSYCPYNTAAMLLKDTTNGIIDHIFYRPPGAFNVLNSSRVFDDNAASAGTLCGTVAVLPLSDHYGEKTFLQREVPVAVAAGGVTGAFSQGSCGPCNATQLQIAAAAAGGVSLGCKACSAAAARQANGIAQVECTTCTTAAACSNFFQVLANAGVSLATCSCNSVVTPCPTAVPVPVPVAVPVRPRSKKGLLGLLGLLGIIPLVLCLLCVLLLCKRKKGRGQPQPLFTTAATAPAFGGPIVV